MKKNIIIFNVLAFLQGLVFVSSVATLYRTYNGISLLEMGIIESIFAFLIMLFEIPWGYIADRIGYKKTIIIANMCYFMSKVVFYLACDFKTFLLERVLLALATSGLSGCDSNLLYLSLDDKNAATGVFAIRSVFGTLGMVISSLSFTFVLDTNMHLGALLTALFYGLAFILCFFLNDYVPKNKSTISLKEIFKALLKNKRIILCLVASTLLTETLHTFTIFYSQVQYQRVNLDIKYYALVFIGLQFIALLSGGLNKLLKYFKKETIALMIYGITFISSIALILADSIMMSIMILAIMSLSEAMYYPIFDAMQNDSIKIQSRATMLSIYSMINNVVMMFTSGCFGGMSSISLYHVYIIGALFSLIGLILFIIYLKTEINSKVFKRYE